MSKDTHLFPNISYTMIDLFQRCERKFWMRYIRHIRMAGRETAKEFGICWHEAMAQRSVGECVEDQIDSFKTLWESFGGDSPNDNKRTFAVAEKMLKGYDTRYDIASEPFRTVKGETFFSLPIEEFNYIGKWDEIIEWEDGIPYVREFKSTTSLGYQFEQRFKPDYQITGYVTAAHELIDSRINSALVDAAWVGKTRPYTGEPFVRLPIAVAEWEREEWKKSFLSVARRINERARDLEEDPHELNFDKFVPNFTACSDYGCCPYRNVCITSPKNRERAIETDFEDAPMRVSK